MKALLTLIATVVVALAAANPAHAESIPLTPPTETSVWVDQLTARNSGERYVLQQWEDDVNNDYRLRIVAAGDNSTLGEYDALTPLYRGKKRVKADYEMWDFNGPGMPVSLQGFREVQNGDLVSGVTLALPRFKWKDGPYTVAFIEEDSTVPQWRCSIYFYDICHWDQGGSTFDYTAALFTMKDGRISDFEVKYDVFVSAKAMDKRFTKWTRR